MKSRLSAVSLQVLSRIQRVSLYPRATHRTDPEGAPDREAAEYEVSPDVTAGAQPGAPRGAPPSLDSSSSVLSCSVAHKS